MRTISKLLALGAAFACSFSSARADQLSISGTDTFTNATITAIGPYVAIGSGPLFSGLTGGTIKFVPIPIIYTTPAYPAFPVFTVSSGPENLTYFATGGTYSLNPLQVSVNGTASRDLALVIDAHGFFTGNYFTGQVPGTLSISTSGEPSPAGSSTTQVHFDATAMAAAPEPDSVVLLGTGILGLFGLARRSRIKSVTN